jgi:TupA-like ATPgrasp
VAYRHDPIQHERPGNLDQMLWVAETIAKDMDFARIDLYSDGKRTIKFGEITFTPGNACSRFSDPRFDKWLGGLFTEDPHSCFAQT